MKVDSEMVCVSTAVLILSMVNLDSVSLYPYHWYFLEIDGFLRINGRRQSSLSVCWDTKRPT